MIIVNAQQLNYNTYSWDKLLSSNNRTGENNIVCVKCSNAYKIVFVKSMWVNLVNNHKIDTVTVAQLNPHSITLIVPQA